MINYVFQEDFVHNSIEELIVDGDSPGSPVPDDESDEEEGLSADIFLSVKNKIRLLLLLGTKRRYNLSYRASESVMELAGVLSDMDFRPTKHLMKKVIQCHSASLSEHHICSNCDAYIGPVIETAECRACGEVIDVEKNKKAGFVFLYLSIEEQLRTLLESGLYTKVIDPATHDKISQFNYEDIFDGAMYKKVVKQCLSFNFFVDGLQVASTSKFSAWPILLCINELPLYLRRKNILMASIWLGKKKPDMKQYMRPFINECIKLERNGLSFTYQGITKVIRLKPLMCVSDSIARPLLRNSSQFNGMVL